MRERINEVLKTTAEAFGRDIDVNAVGSLLASGMLTRNMIYVAVEGITLKAALYESIPIALALAVVNNVVREVYEIRNQRVGGITNES